MLTDLIAAASQTGPLECRLSNGQFLMIMPDFSKQHVLVAFMNATNADRLRLNREKTKLLLAGGVEVPVKLKTHAAHPGRVHVYHHVSDLKKAEEVLRYMVNAMRA